MQPRGADAFINNPYLQVINGNKLFFKRFGHEGIPTARCFDKYYRKLSFVTRKGQLCTLDYIAV